LEPRLWKWAQNIVRLPHGISGRIRHHRSTLPWQHTYASFATGLAGISTLDGFADRDIAKSDIMFFAGNSTSDANHQTESY